MVSIYYKIICPRLNISITLVSGLSRWSAEVAAVEVPYICAGVQEGGQVIEVVEPNLFDRVAGV